MKPLGVVRGQRVGASKLAAAKLLRRVSTAEERLMWERLRANRLQGIHFRRQQVIDGYVADFYCHSAGLVIELDGPIHLDQQEEDAYRDNVLSAHGLTVLRIANASIANDIDAVLMDILRAVEANSQSVPLPSQGRG